MNYNPNDFHIHSNPEDEWTWIDDLFYAAKMIAVILSVVVAFGFVVWKVI